MLHHLEFGAVFAGPFANLLLSAALTTFKLTVASWLLAIGLGTVLAVLRASGVTPLRKAVEAFVSYHQNIPLLAQIFLWYFGVPTLLPDAVQSWVNAHDGEVIYASIAIGLCMSAFFSEDIRSGLRSVPHGQYEASRSLGLSFFATMRFVTFPLAFRSALPSFVNHTVMMFKDTSLAMAIGAAEMTYVVRQIENETFRTFEAYAVATAFYLAVSLGLMGLGAMVANRIQIKAR
ncbi:amino acid ABC transporter permease [Pandoraea iniqua]|uniref:Amino acid ABC transporter permease n=1 Tax=Pandoraea iniqua TaxID=2508288 RepID=A0A5E4VFR6_9BURK|nr:amino acid ABC transporter permease [Pandoraea iniqua]VVE10404.1 amino acid ABC transporter permease [Pandoraea iniqua]